jgi:hypothetical protein
LNLTETEVARLQQLEQEQRNRMRSYLTEQLAQIEPNPPPGFPHPAGNAATR